MTHSHSTFPILLSTILLSTICLSTGCASAHKRAETRHELWRFNATGQVTAHEVWTDSHRGGGLAFLADPKASQLHSAHTNQSALGGASTLRVGEVGATVSTDGIKAVGGAVGEALKQSLEGIK